MRSVAKSSIVVGSLLLVMLASLTVSSKAFVSTAARRMSSSSSSVIRPALVSKQSQSSFSSMTLHASSSSSSTIQELIQNEIDNHQVVVFSKSRCPFCAMTKQLFRETLGVEDFKVIELDLRPDGGDIQKELAQMTGQRTVPNTFVNQQHVGGNDNAQAAYASGDLQKLLGM